MKKILSISILIACFSLIITGCEKKAERIADFTMTTPTEAQLKINFNSAYTANPSVHIKINDVRVSNLITTRTPFPGGGYNTGGDSRPDYLAVTPGGVKLSIAIPAKKYRHRLSCVIQHNTKSGSRQTLYSPRYRHRGVYKSFVVNRRYFNACRGYFPV